MVGCRYGAKNTLVKNYLWFAERRGVQVLPERQATEIRPLGAGRRLRWLRGDDRHTRGLGAPARANADARAAWWSLPGPWAPTSCSPTAGTRARCPGSRERLGHVVRTNSESIQAVTAPDDSRDFARSVAITSSIYPDPDTHIEVVTYGRGGRRDQPPLHGDDRAGHPASRGR